MKKLLLIMIVSMGVLSSCVEEKNKYVMARMIDGNDTISTRLIVVERNFRVGDVIIPYSAKGDKVRYKIVRECRN
jgi:hypothetical protein